MKIRVQYILIMFVAMLIMLSPIISDAHVKWFTEVTPKKESIEQILTPLFMIMALSIAAFLAVLSQIWPSLDNIPFFQKLEGRLDGYRKYSRYILKYGTAVALIVQASSGSIFAPELFITNTIVSILLWITIGLLLIPVHYATKVAALLLLGLFIYTTKEFGIFYMLDYGFYLAIIGVLLVGKTKLEDWGFPFLYLGTGLSLCWVAVEKWVYPVMSENIIINHQVPTFGFAPTTFIVMAAFIEFVVGYLLVVGILNRLLAFVLTLIFISTTMLFGTTEIIGHLMIHIVLIIFIIEGVSFYDPPIRRHDTRIDQMIFVFLNFIFTLSTFILIYYRFA
ncbi:DoxX family membrane protein [Bacillus sp. HMF5848]|uniref:DoxX family membrane protein n=1 Tax=Bacillus sp. HMF5848 TaxID=2495421 RepID=UPI000F781937|nr:DoxX family membrane protein [Bacillus sp. HMF5848]RSK26286.1 DoxX family membrane protein [Bacillus sp. HMF5848]